MFIQKKKKKEKKNELLIKYPQGHVTVNNINVNGTVQKRRVSEEFVRKSDNLQTITGNKLFKGPLTLDSVHVVDSINGETPSKLCERPPPPQPSKWIIRGGNTQQRNPTYPVDK